jgi:hypothetical protein
MVIFNDTFMSGNFAKLSVDSNYATTTKFAPTL